MGHVFELNHESSDKVVERVMPLIPQRKELENPGFREKRDCTPSKGEMKCLRAILTFEGSKQLISVE